VSALLAIVVGSLVFLAGRALVGRRNVARLERRVRPHVHVESRQHEGATGDRSRLRRRLDRIERWLEGRESYESFVLRTERAGVDRRPVDVLALVVAVAVVLALLGALAGSPALGVVLLLAAPGIAWLALGVLAQRRVKAFDEQLPDLLAALSSSLRAGHGFLQSLHAVANDAPDPTGAELRRALLETRLGRPVDEALAGVSRRIPSKEFGYVLTAIVVQRQVGGSLAGLFETVNETVRQRQQFARKVRALTATGRTSAYALVGLPFGVALLLTLLNHAYLTPLFTTHAGRLMVAFGLFSLFVGSVLVRRIVSFKG
jgi:tight adherence protein B